MPEQPRLISSWDQVEAEVRKARKGSGPPNAAFTARLGYTVGPDAVTVAPSAVDAWWWSSARFAADHRGDLEAAVWVVYALPVVWAWAQEEVA